MGLLDNYRRTVTRLKTELTTLQRDRARESENLSKINVKINSASQAINRTKITSTINSKLREIASLEKKSADSYKKIAQLDKKIADKSKNLSNEEKKLTNEEIKESKRMQATRERELQEINTTLVSQQYSIKRLQELPKKINVLFMASNPVDQVSLTLDQEAREINEAITKSKHRDSVEFITRWAAQPLDVLQAINETSPTIIHFSGHGSSNDELVLQDKNGNTKLISKDAIVQSIATSCDSVRLVIFNTCCSFEQANEMVQHIEVAIGMSEPIGDETAKIFATQLYSAIGFGLSIQQAFDQAISALKMEGCKDADVPQLYIAAELNSDEIILVQP